MFHADTHIHSRFSRACSKDCDIPNLAWWALRKGITVVGTGDFTHPAWSEELKESLVPAEPGLFKLREDLQTQLRRKTAPSCDRPVRFMLSVEISTIYRRDDRTRKVHHLLYAPTFEAADRITTALSKIGNLASDGRPILGLDSRDLLEITLNGGPGCYLVPAHVWTPWFAVLGSKSGFDRVADCYADLADHVFAVETGLSSDPPMNWMCSTLDSYRLVSNSDAHSPPMLGREATTFSTGLDYFEMADALRTGDGLAGTIEFYPEEGKYHLDGHRKCGVRLEPEQTRDYRGICPKCDKPLTVGVLNRVAMLADRPLGYQPAKAPSSTNLIRLPQIIGEIMSVGPQSKKVAAEAGKLVAALGPEIEILTDAPLDEITKIGGGLLAEAIARLRRGEVIREAGFDGEYGTVRLMHPGDLAPADALFDLPPAAPKAAPPATTQAAPPPTTRPTPATPAHSAVAPPANSTPSATETTSATPAHPAATVTTAAPADGPGAALLERLDPQQRAAVTASGPVLIVAGPGTGKTRTLTHRIAYLIATGRVQPGQCLAITFTRRAAEEMRERLAALVGPASKRLTVTTFHGLGLQILRENHELAGFGPDVKVADEAATLAVATALAGSATAGQRLLAQAATDPAVKADLLAELGRRDLVDFDSLIDLPVALLRREPVLRAVLRDRWPCVSVDEYQDINEPQYTLLRQLTAGSPADASLTMIGDPDQAIYGFRGSDVGFFLRFPADFPRATTIDLTTNYRSAPAIVAASMQAVAPATLMPGRELQAAQPPPPRSRPASIVFHEVPNERAEAEWIAAETDRLLGGASFHSLDSGRADGQGHGGLGLADVAILYRTDSQAAFLTQALTRAGLPFQKRSHDRLAQRAAVPEIIREMRLAATPHSATAAPTSLPDPAGALNPPIPTTATPDVADAKTVTSRLREAVRRLTAGESAPVAADIRAAGEVLRPLADRCGRDMQQFLTEIAVGAEADALDPRADAVTLLTLHAAKGLEYDVVFLAGCERGLLPLWIPGTDRDEAEERRLLFVGMTRARARLFLTCAATRTRYGADRPSGPSLFLSAIAPNLLSRTTPPTARPRAARQLRLL
ncbi:MAG TPA: UvrD-helicase domain-containing protein [Streptosporangiaceae bacterium]|jgi:uncharacterized protein (TIGR00375 family)|nr:UvrD-helicase domain-containing protein [Streptosporangiaceae bacterium]